MSPGLLLLAAALQQPLVVASKPFGESYLLAELFAQRLEAFGVPVTRRPGLGSTEIALRALREGAIDVYPEYTGTGLLAVLGDTSRLSSGAAFRKVASEFHERWNLYWLPPLGFENTYAIALRPETAREHGLRTLSDLARVAPALRAGLTPDFIGRADGLPGLSRAYGLRFGSVRALVPAVKYKALAAGEVDVVDGYSTDGLIQRYDLVVLEDDRRFFPPYDAAPVVSARFYGRANAVAALSTLAGRLDVARVREWNRRIEVEGERVEDVARAALAELDPAPAAGTSLGRAQSSLPGYFRSNAALLLRLTLRHLLLVAICLLAAVAAGLPLGLLLERYAQAEVVIRALGVVQTIPSIALLAFMIPLLGIGVVPALTALFLYALYPVVRNTYTGVRAADPSAVASARALGMTPAQILTQVRLPIAAPVVMAGIRAAAVIAVGTATLAAFIGAGGLGDPIVSGLALADTRMILLGAIPAALLALVIDGVLGIVERRLTPYYQKSTAHD